MAEVKISVVIPMYNREKYIKEAIESVLNQTFQEFEIIVLDDCSTDNSCEIVESLIAVDQRITLIKFNQKSGISKLRNYGNKLAKGKYISVFDSDDIMPNYRLRKQFEFMEKKLNIGVVGGGMKTLGEEGDSYTVRSADSEEINIGLIFHTMIFHGTALIRKSVLIENGLTYNEEYPYAEDWALWVNMINKVQMTNQDCNMLFYRRHSDSITVQTRTDHQEMKIRQKKMNMIFRKALENIGFNLTEEEIKIFVFFNEEHYQHEEMPTEKDCILMIALLKKMEKQTENLGINKQKFISIAYDWINKKKRLYRIV